MYLVIIFGVQFYFLARFFKKSKWKTVFSAVGLYFLYNFFVIFVFMSLLMMNVIEIGVELPQIPSEESVKNYSEAITKYFIEHNIPIIIELSSFVLIGIIYFNVLKRKWMKKVIQDNAPVINEIKEKIEVMQLTRPVESNFYLHFHEVNEKNIHLIPELAKEIWDVCYKGIISQEQIDYMLEMMYNEAKINEAIEAGEVWKILKADNVPMAYLHYKKEDQKLFLSKIYLKQEEQYKGLGQYLLNDVISYAVDHKLESIYLEVNRNNAKAIRFYEKNGFKQTNAEVTEIGNGYVMDSFYFEKKIKIPQLG